MNDRPDTRLFDDLSKTLLAERFSVRFRARGGSMRPSIEDSDFLYLVFTTLDEVRKDDIVLFRDGTGFKAHRVTLIDHECGVFVTQGDSASDMDSPATAAQLVGKVVAREDRKGKLVSLCGRQARMRFRAAGARRIASKARRAVPRVASVFAHVAGLARQAALRPMALMVFLAVLLSAVQLHGQVAVDNETNATAQVTGTPATINFNHTVSGTNRLLVVGVSINLSNNTGTTVSGVTYNGISLTQAVAHNDTTNSPVTRRAELWYLSAPAVGTNLPVVVTLSLPGGTGPVGVVAAAISFVGVDQTTTPIRSTAVADGPAAAGSSLAITSAAGDLVLDALAIRGNRTVTEGAGQTAQWTNQSGTNAARDVRGFGTTEGGAASVTMTEAWTGGTSTWSQAAISIKPFGVSADAATMFGSNVTGAAPNVSFTHTTAAGNNRLLVVGISLNIAGNTGATVTGVTYSGTPLTRAGFRNEAGNTRRVEMWYRINPPTGTNLAGVVTLGLPGGTGTVGVVVGATTLTGVDQTVPVRSFVSADGPAASTYSQLNVTSGPGEIVIDTLATAGNVTAAATAPQTLHWGQASTATANPGVYGLGSRRTGAASVPLSETFSGASSWSMGALSVRPYQADLSVAMSGNSTFFNAPLTYAITVTNNGTSPATGVLLSDTLAAGLTFGSATSSQGTCTGTGPVTCDLGTLPSGMTATVTVTGTPTSRGGYANTARVTSDVPDYNLGNNSTIGTAFSQTNACPVAQPRTPALTPLTGVINTYFPVTSNAASGATSITNLGTATGSTTPISAGDLLLVVQMQDAAINSVNDQTYGDGVSGSGFTNLNNAGVYEYITATNTVAVAGAGKTLNFTGAGLNGGLIYSYTNANASATQGQRRFQIVRVPQYSTATLGSALTAAPWNGTTGGILALDLSGVLTLNGANVSVDGLGFRGGAGLQLSGNTTALNTDFRFTAPPTYTGAAVAGADGAKGEGIAGTPHWVNFGTNNFTDTGVEGYPNGSMAKGAPGNGGGGGTDGDPQLASPGGNDQNSGGGGGGNGGAGGSGGNSWNSNLSNGGLGGGAFPANVGRIVLGGGGGAGTRNNSDGLSLASAGAAGGGIVIVRAGALSGTATITANGAAAANVTANDSGGGGGAGGSIVVLSANGGESGLTISAQGGRGGDSWNTQAFALTERHGPGGGGGGGVVQLTGPAVSVNVNGGGNGVTLTPGVPYGATAGTAGAIRTDATFNQQPGIQPGAECVPDLTVAKTHAPSSFVRGQTGTYTLTVTNISTGPTAATAGTVTVVDTLPTGLTATAISGTGWSCTLATRTCTRSDVLAAGASYPAITVTVSVLQSAANPVTNTATVSGGNEIVTSNDTASDVTSVASSSNMTIAKTASTDTVRQGSALTYTLTVTNGGPSNSTNVVVTDMLPSGVTYVSATSTQGTCSRSGATVTCNVGATNVGGVVIITVNVTASVPSIVTNTATVSATEPDPVPANNTASVDVTITYPTEVTLENFTATENGTNVLLSWTTGSEMRNVGFNIYRESNGQRVMLNPSLIAGSALMVRGGLPEHSAKTYTWVDHSPASGQWYWLEDVDLNGTRTLHGPVGPERDGNAFSSASLLATTSVPAPRALRARTIAEVNTAIATPSSIQSTSHLMQAVPTWPVRRRGPRDVQFQLAARAAVKIVVDHEGWYRITQPQLAAAGLNTSVDPRTLQLFAEGVEQVIRTTGAADGWGGFGPQAAIEFYATGIDTPYTGQRAYWLVAGDQFGKRAGEWRGMGSGGPTAQSFMETVELRQKTTYFPALLKDDADNFFGALVYAAPVDQVLSTPGVAAAALQDGKLQIALQGVIDGAAHNVRVSVNGVSVGEIKFEGQDEAKFDLPVSHDLFRPDHNVVTLMAQNGADDLSLVEYVRLSYPRALVAASDTLKFTASAGDHVVVSGFQQRPARLVDITDPGAPVVLAVQVGTDGTGLALEGKVPHFPTGTHTLMALTEAQLAAPAAIVANSPSSWNRVQLGAEFVVVSAPKFLAQVSPLVQLRRNQGRSVALVSLEDIYDEFNFGEKSPAALRDFLQTATTNWSRRPSHLLLVGDASFDARNYQGLGDFDFVPTKSIVTAELKTASDDWFSDFTNAGLAQIATGRLPVRTEDDAVSVVNKIIAYESGQDQGAWASQAMLVADKDDNVAKFTQQAKSIQALLPSSLTVTDVFAGSMTTSAAKQAVLDGINSGKLLVNYNGHGSVEIWSNNRLLDSAAASALTNGTRLPVFVMMNCLNGFFHDIYTHSLAEALLLSRNGGAVAVWASSGLTSAGPQFQMDRTFMSALSAAPAPTLGDAIRAAKQSITDLDVRRTFVLFGDPMMKLRGPGSGVAGPQSPLRTPFGLTPTSGVRVQKYAK